MRIPYSPQTPRVSALAISTNDQFCAIGYGPSFDNQYHVDVWDIARGEAVDKFTVPSRPITLKFMDDGKLITIRADSVVEQRDIKDGETLWKYSLCLESLLAIDERLNWAYSPDGRFIATVSRRNLRVWDTSLRRPLWEVNAGPDQEFQLPAFSSDSRYVATVVNHLSSSQSSALIIADSSSGRMITSHKLEDQLVEPTALIFSRDDDNLFIAAKEQIYGRSKLLVINRNFGIVRVLTIGQDEYYRIVQDDTNSAVLYLLSERTITAFNLSSENILWTRSCREQPI